MRQRASAFTPWIVSEDLVKQYNIPSKLASVFTQPSFNFSGKKRKLEETTEKVKKPTGETQKKVKVETEKIKKEPSGPDAPRKKPGPKPGFKRTPKVETKDSKPVPVKVEAPVKMETSDSDDDVSLAVLASKSPTSEAASSGGSKEKEKGDSSQSVKRESEKEVVPNKKMKQATLFEMKSSSKPPGSGTAGTPTSPNKSPAKKASHSDHFVWGVGYYNNSKNFLTYGDHV